MDAVRGNQEISLVYGTIFEHDADLVWVARGHLAAEVKLRGRAWAVGGTSTLLEGFVEIHAMAQLPRLYTYTFRQYIIHRCLMENAAKGTGKEGKGKGNEKKQKKHEMAVAVGITYPSVFIFEVLHTFATDYSALGSKYGDLFLG